VDVVVAKQASPDLVDDISPDPLDIFHAFSSCLLPSFSLECHNMSLVNYQDMLEKSVVHYVECLGTFRWYDPSFDP